MKSFTEFREDKQRLDPKCWDGYKKKGTKMKGDTQVNDCVKEVEEAYYSDKDKKQKETLKKHDKSMIKISRDSIKKYEKAKQPLPEDIDKTIARHESGIRKAKTSMKIASSNQNMVKHMNALAHHKKALKTAMMRQSLPENEAYDKPAVKKPVSKMTPAEKQKNDDRRLAYKTYQKMRTSTSEGYKQDFKRKEAAHEYEMEKKFRAKQNTTKKPDAKKKVTNPLDTNPLKEEGIKSGHKRKTEDGAGLTQKGVDAENRRTGGNLQTAVTTPPSKLKAGSKAAGRRKSFCARSKSWDGERGKAARSRWNC